MVGSEGVVMAGIAGGLWRQAIAQRISSVSKKRKWQLSYGFKPSMVAAGLSGRAGNEDKLYQSKLRAGEEKKKRNSGGICDMT